MNYKETVLTPKTDFAMRANLVQREPDQQTRWAQQQIYAQIRTARQGRPQWVLHDGPPYANGDIHMGHVLNKVLKDIIVKFRTMQGFDVPYVPGWDCHGLPIEHKVMTELGPRIRDMSASQIRERCHEHAQRYIDIQSKQFQRLGIFGQFDKPYLTMNPSYEADVLEVFAKLVEQGLVYRQLKPVHWCAECVTSLAEAELEYQDRKDTSIFVNFEVTSESRTRLGHLPTGATVSLMIWTTTPWTLPANMAIAVHPDFEYRLVSYTQQDQPRVSIIAEGLVDYAMTAGGITDYKKLHSFTGQQLAGCTYHHAFIERINPVVTADYVTLRDDKGNPAGTGLVHTAPGHGLEDYHTGLQNKIEIYSPVKNDGTFDETTPDWLQGKTVWAGNKLVCERLSQTGHMFHQHEFLHSYPHCWRSKTPTVFRCTEQWFISVDQALPATGQSLRQMAMTHVQEVQWIPGWGQTRIEGMLSARPDWCISRQRAWGLPIPAFFDPQGRSIITPELVRAVSTHFRNKGSNSWFTDSPEQILGNCPLPDGLHAQQLTKQKDIFDVWFESGSSWAAVCVAEGYQMPVQLYLEGSDQHRGWFQLSLLPALGAIYKPPFKSVLTHGFIVDETGRKMSKSLGNVVDPQKEIDKYGADIIRLWVASIDYQDDIRCSDNLINKLSDEYRKVRNTIRYALGALYDSLPNYGVDHQFDPQRDSVSVDQNSIDAWARLRLHQMIGEVTRLNDQYAFYKVFKKIHDFCNIDLSQIYFVALKDRLYCDAANSRRRRRAQTVLYEIADHLIRLIAPILVHTAEEAWQLLPGARPTLSVHLAPFPKPDLQALNKTVEQDWELILQLRESAMQQLEQLKRDQGLNNPLDAMAIYHVNETQRDMLIRYDDGPADVLGVGSHRIELTNDDPHIVIADVREKYQRCARCWKRREDVGSDPEYPDLSRRDSQVIRQLSAK
ncbi:MAG: Isoleucine--tRNA ligase [Phycisphaerae bacterium]|nr:Isoleucine--tRNA ligase [Phycisphaerae bacterium]